MDKKDTKKPTDYVGVDINVADDEKTTPRLVKQETKELNNNPRNNDIDQ